MFTNHKCKSEVETEMSVVEGIDVTIEGVLADGTPVKAKCRYRAKDISVEMLSPYPGQHAGRHIRQESENVE